MLTSITRGVSSSIERCELTHLERERIDVERARAQHREYERCLTALGCTVVRLAEEPELAKAEGGVTCCRLILQCRQNA